MDFDSDADGLKLQHLAGSDIVANAPVYSPNGEFLLIITNRIVQIFSTTTGELTRQLTGANAKIIAIEFELKDEQTLVGCTAAGELLRWKWGTGRLESTLPLEVYGEVQTFNLMNMYDNAETACAFVVTKAPREAMKWSVINTRTGRKLYIQCSLPLKQKLPSVAVDTKNFPNIVIAQGEYVYFLNYVSWQWTRLRNAHHVPVTVVRLHPTEEMVATGDEKGRIFLWRQFMDQKTVCTSLYHWHHTSITSISFTATGSSMYSSGLESVLVKWNVGRPELQNFVPRMASIIMHTAVSSFNNQLAVCTADNGVQLIGNDDRIKCTLQEFTYIVNDKTDKDKFPVGLRLDPRTNTLVLNGRIGHLQFYSVYSKNLLYNMDIVAQNQLSMETNHILYNIRVTKAAFNIDWMATGEVYNDEEHLPELRLKFWKYQKETHSYTLNTNVELPHEGGFKAIEFSNDYQVDNLLCATVGEDNIIKMWCLEESDNIYKKGKVWYCIAQTSYKSMPIESISFSQDGSLLAAGYGNTLCIYKSDTLKLKAALTGSAGTDGAVKKAQLRLPKQHVNGSKNELAEQRKKILQLFTNLLESNEETLINELRKSLASNKKDAAATLKPLVQVDSKQKQMLYNEILRMHELNLFQKVLLFQRLQISCKVHPQWQQTVAGYLCNTVANVGIKQKFTRLQAQTRRLNVRDRFKAKYRLQRFGTAKSIYDAEISRNLVPILSVLNLNVNSKQPQLSSSKDKEREQNHVTEDANVAPTSGILTSPQTFAEISHVQFAAGEWAHLVIVCTEHRMLIWNLLTLRLQSVLKLSVEHLSLDPQTNLIAAFTKNKELHVFQPNVPMPIYQRRNLPSIKSAIWLPRRYPKPRSINLDWQAQSTLYFLTESQEIMYLGLDNDSFSDGPPPITFKQDSTAELSYSTFGTFATKQTNETQNKIRHTGPLIIGLAGKTAVKSLIEMSTHTMPPLSLLCGEFVKSLVKPTTDATSNDEKPNAARSRSIADDDDGDIQINGNANSDEEHADDAADAAADVKTQMRKNLLAKAQEIKKEATPNAITAQQRQETELRRVADQTIEIEF